jgi:predicted PolB exonuclease-like 3'-5' exonuclease
VGKMTYGDIMNNTLDEYIKKYEQKTKDKFKPKEGFKLFYLPSRGFCELSTTKNNSMLMIYQMAGDGKFWRDFATVLAQMLGIKKLGTICIRENIKAYIRFWGYKITKKEPLNDGSFIYYAENKEGKKARVSPVHMHDDITRISYYVTWDI